MMRLDRTDATLFGRWWWTVDRWTLAAIFVLIVVGAVMVFAASPATALRMGMPEFHFAERHVVYLALALVTLIGASFLDPVLVRRLAVWMLLISMIGVLLTLFIGVEIKGATRWLSFGGLSVQPSEFVKPAFAVVTGWLFSLRATSGGWMGHVMAIVLLAVILGLLLRQPDLGMSVVIAAVWCVQFFVAGLPMIAAIGCVVLAIGGLVAAYLAIPHVTSRIDRFLDPSTGDTLQIDQSLSAFRAGGLFGTGPGEGTVKLGLPDAHADFIFAVAAEEFGVIACALIVLLFVAILLRGMHRLSRCSDLFALLAGAGLLVQFSFQALINMASALHMIPTKGMTLPFVSYGGSSMVALALGLGVVLALTRSRPSQVGPLAPIGRRSAHPAGPVASRKAGWA